MRYCCITFILTAAHTTPYEWDWKARALAWAVWVTNPSLNGKNLVEEDCVVSNGSVLSSARKAEPCRGGGWGVSGGEGEGG